MYEGSNPPPVPAGLGWPDGDFGEYAMRVCQQVARNPALGCRMMGVREALRRRDAETLLGHLWSEDAGHVLAEIAWAIAQREQRRTQTKRLNIGASLPPSS